MKTEQDSEKEPESKPEGETTGCGEAPIKMHPTVEELHKKNEELFDKLMRLQADFENYKKRAAKEKEEFIQLAAARMVKELLGLLDDFDRAISGTRKDDGKSARQGLEIMRDQLKEILRREGVAEIETKCRLDPFQHEVISKVDDKERGDDEIVECLQKGYKMKGRVIRPARVVVCRRENMNIDEAHQDNSFDSKDKDTEVN